jgi:hypothetical protein
MNAIRRLANSFLPLGRRYLNALSIIIFLLALLSYFNYVENVSITGFDDAYMFVRYADNFLSGYGVAWNRDGTQTYGVTSILYLFWIVVLRWLFPEVDSANVLIRASALFGLLAIGVNTITINSFVRSKTLAKLKLPLAASMTYLLLSPIYRFHAVSGMDTTLSIFVNSVLALLAFRLTFRSDPRSMLLTVLAGYLSFLARPDNLLYAICLPVSCQLLLSDIDQKKTSTRYLLGLFAVLLIDSIAKWTIFGDPLPLPFYAKTNGYYEGYIGAYQWNPMGYLIYFGSLVLPFLVLISLFVRKESMKIISAFMIPVAVTFAYFFSVVQIMGMEARYYVPALPFFVISSFLVLDRYLEEQHRNSYTWWLAGRHIRLRLLVIFGLITLLVQPAFRIFAGDIYERLFLLRDPTSGRMVNYKTASGQFPPELGWWSSIQAVSSIASNLPQGTRVAMSEYGFIGAQSPNVYIIDPLGLNDPIFAHQGFSAFEFFDRKPDLIWLPHPDYTAIVSSILNANEFWMEYDYYPGAFDYGIAIRRDSVSYQIIYEMVEKVWQQRYKNLELNWFLARPVP